MQVFQLGVKSPVGVEQKVGRAAIQRQSRQQIRHLRRPGQRQQIVGGAFGARAEDVVHFLGERAPIFAILRQRPIG